MRRVVLASLVLGLAAGCAVRPDSGGDPALEPTDAPPARADGANGANGDGDPTAPPSASDPAGTKPSDPAAPAAPVARCDPKKPLGAPQLVAGFETSTISRAARLSADEKTMYLTRAMANVDILRAEWSEAAKTWTAPTALKTIDTTANDGSPSVTADGLTMFFHSDRTTPNSYDIWVSRRASTDKDWGAPAKVTALSGPAEDVNPAVRADGKMVVFSSTRSGNPDLFVSYADETGALGAPRALTELNTPGAQETDPVISADGLTIYFARGGSERDVYVARRAKVSDPFGAPAAVGDVNTAADDRPSWISADDCVLYLSKADSATSDHLYVAQRGR